MTEERASYDANRRAVRGRDGVEHIGDIIRQLVDDRQWQDALATQTNGHPTPLPRDRRHGHE